MTYLRYPNRGVTGCSELSGIYATAVKIKALMYIIQLYRYGIILTVTLSVTKICI